RLILAHHYPDHMGLAGWLVDKFGIPVYMTDTEFLLSQHLAHTAQTVDVHNYEDFYRRHGMDGDLAHIIINQGHRYKRIITGLPWPYRPLDDGSRLNIGGRDFEIMTGGGHSVSQAMLLSHSEKNLLPPIRSYLALPPTSALTPSAPRQTLSASTFIRCRASAGMLTMMFSSCQGTNCRSQTCTRVSTSWPGIMIFAAKPSATHVVIVRSRPQK
ncbi:MAG: hypothetical protein M0R29_22925, partial [Aquamicrobium sp.]|nr:hypothetical protein [Aquamicrobium sp.]